MTETDPDLDNAPPPAAGDDKDWTWVLSEACPECGLRAETIAGPTIPELVADAALRWQVVLARPDARRRPAEHVWSPLEYACHARDVFRVFAGRVQLMLDHDAPTFPNWDQDETALAERYWAQQPAVVADELSAEASHAASTFAAVRDDEWARVGLRSNGSRFTVMTLGQYFMHDVIHHLHDVSG